MMADARLLVGDLVDRGLALAQAVGWTGATRDAVAPAVVAAAMLLVFGAALAILLVLMRRQKVPAACSWKRDAFRPERRSVRWVCGTCGVEQFSWWRRKPRRCKREVRPIDTWA